MVLLLAGIILWIVITYTLYTITRALMEACAHIIDEYRFDIVAFFLLLFMLAIDVTWIYFSYTKIFLIYYYPFYFGDHGGYGIIG